MEFGIFFSALLLALLILALLLTIRQETVYEYQRGLLYRRGKFVRVLEPGAKWIFRPFEFVQRIDIRTNYVTIPGQEVLTADNVSIKVSVAAAYQVTDPYKAATHAQNFHEALYLVLQINIRDAIGALTVEELLAKRATVGQTVFENSQEKAAEIGLKLSLVSIKDIMFPGELKTIFAQVVNARQQGLAVLEKARGESAALRNLANTAQLFENHPHLMQMRLLQTLESQAGKNVIILPTELMSALNQQKEK
jgi:regulator of protease activity HflC (stomatin/prohibitin superfamily)